MSEMGRAVVPQQSKGLEVGVDVGLVYFFPGFRCSIWSAGA